MTIEAPNFSLVRKLPKRAAGHATFAIALSWRIILCPGDDILAMTATAATAGHSVEAVLPQDLIMKPKLVEINLGKPLKKRLPNNRFKFR